MTFNSAVELNEHHTHEYWKSNTEKNKQLIKKQVQYDYCTCKVKTMIYFELHYTFKLYYTFNFTIYIQI